MIDLIVMVLVVGIVIGTVDRWSHQIDATTLTPGQGCGLLLVMVPLGVATSALTAFVEWRLYLFVAPSFGLPAIDFPTAWMAGLLINCLVRGWTPRRVRVEDK